MRTLGVCVAMTVAAGLAVAGCASRTGPATPAPFPGAVSPAPSSPAERARPTPDAPGRDTTLRIEAPEHGTLQVRDVALERYVAATALSEFSPAAGDSTLVERMLEVQAIVARTYALRHLGRHGSQGFDLCATTHCQLYEPGRLETSRWAAAAIDAARKTAGQVLYYGSAPAETLFHADCGGRLASAADVWGGEAPPYLFARPDAGVLETTHRTWTFTTRADALLAALREAGLVPGDLRRLTSITIAERDSSGRARTLRLNGSAGPSVRAVDLRSAAARAFGAASIKSTLFTVRVSGDAVTFAGSGFGHGVGLCQAGAYARVTAGTSVPDVLQFYYPGTTLGRLGGRAGS